MTTELLRRSLEMIGRLRDDLNGMEDNESLELSLYSVDLENQISAALSQPAKHPRWLVEADRLINELAGSAIGMYAEELVNARHDLRAHLRARPAPEGFVLVPVELIEVFKHQKQCDADGIEIAVSRQAVDELLSMIEAAKESGT